MMCGDFVEYFVSCNIDSGLILPSVLMSYLTEYFVI